MAVYNGSKFLSEAIESILNQTFTDWELLIINDGSTDHSVKIISEFTEPRIRLLHNTENMGLVYTRNKGIKEARGKYFAILDCDDIAFPQRLEIELNYMKTHPELALCSGRAVFIDSNGNALHESEKYWGNKNIRMIFNNILINSATIFKTEIVRSVGAYHEHAPAEDYDLGLRIAEKYPIATVDDVLVKYRLHDSNTSATTTTLHQAERSLIIDFHKRYGISSTLINTGIHHSFIVGSMDSFSIDDIATYFIELKAKVKASKQFATLELDRFLFQKWVELIMVKGGRMTFMLFFRSGIFHYSFMSFKQLRRAFKKGIRETF
ncbi:MAG: glycosyltransferase [Sphingobacteriaceae bacterium]|nr:glycosyltransferase [Sphingobacteriaceae bacterium]